MQPKIQIMLRTPSEEKPNYGYMWWLNNGRYHEAIENVIPADKFHGRDPEVLKNQEKARKQTMKR